MNPKYSHVYAYIDSYDPRLRNVLTIVKNYKEDPVEKLREMSREIFEYDLPRSFKRSRGSFDQFAGRFLCTNFYSNYSDRFSIQDQNCLKYLGKSFDFYYIENADSREIKITIHQDVIELLGLGTSVLYYKYKRKARLRLEYLVKCDDFVAESCSLVRPFIEWRLTKKYKACKRAVKYLVKRIDEILWKSSDETMLPSFELRLKDEAIIELTGSYYNEGFESCIRLARYRTDIDKTLNYIVKVMEQRDMEWRQQKEEYQQLEIKKKQKWIDAISCYIKGEMIDQGNDEDIAFFDYVETYDYKNPDYYDYIGPLKNNERLLLQVNNNGIYPMPGLNHWTPAIKSEIQSWLIEKVARVSADAFYNQFLKDCAKLHIKLNEKAILSDIPGTKGKTLHISLNAIDFDYSDATHQAIFTLKEKYMKYYREVKPMILNCCPKLKEGVNIIRVLYLDNETLSEIKEEVAFEKPLEIQIVHKLRYLYDVVRPLLSIRRGEEIGYFNTIDITTKSEKLIEVTLRLDGCRCGDSAEYKYTGSFGLDENFEKTFKVWWQRALLFQVKWLKSSISEISSNERHY